MFLRVKDGRYAGEIREFEYLDGKALLDSGRAENPFVEPDLASSGTVPGSSITVLDAMNLARSTDPAPHQVAAVRRRRS